MGAEDMGETELSCYIDCNGGMNGCVSRSLATKLKPEMLQHGTFAVR
jgi:hypothetical protein